MRKTKKTRGKATEHVETLMEDHFVALTPQEYDARAQQLASINQEVAALEDRKKSVVANLGAEAKRLISERAKLTLVVKNREELRPVQVEVFKDYTLGELIAVRQDTKEVVRSRPLSPDERQTEIPGARQPKKTGGEHVTDKPPKGEKGKKLTGQTKPNDVEKPE